MFPLRLVINYQVAMMSQLATPTDRDREQTTT